MATYIIVSIIAYLIGSISFSVIFSKKIGGFDVRTKGSGNAGSTNVLRTVGKKAAVLTLLCDCLKGVVAVLIAVIAGNIAKNLDKALLVQLAGIFVVLGHTFPVFFKFKGGKGVATSLGTIFIHTNYIVSGNYIIFGIILALFVIYNHRTNINRLLEGKENKLDFSKLK